MGIAKKELEEIDKRFKACNEQNYLKIVLESYSKYNHRARLDIVKILYKNFIRLDKQNAKLNLRKNLLAEILTKLLQILEDSALIAIMFMDRSKTPFQHFINTDNRMFANFFGKAKRGFSDQQILRIYGLKTAEQLFKNGSIKKSEVLPFKREFQKMLHSDTKPKGEVVRWKYLGKLYTEMFTDPSSQKRGYKKVELFLFTII